MNTAGARGRGGTLSWRKRSESQSTPESGVVHVHGSIESIRPTPAEQTTCSRSRDGATHLLGNGGEGKREWSGGWRPSRG